MTTLTRTAPERAAPAGPVETPLAAPRADVVSLPDEVVLVADLPGVRPEDVELSVENDVLTIRAKASHRDVERESWMLHETGPAAYERRFRLGRDLAADEISAESKDGVLTVHFPKVSARRARTVPVAGD